MDSNVFHKLTKKLHTQVDEHMLEVEVREDEEQHKKLQEIIDLLVAAGYFRARIKGLLPFDKVVGGMTWCIESCNVDVDVDLLFQENSTIGQKIALTEIIVMVLPKMKCPHNIEPHQIQGLDFIHIFPVIQEAMDHENLNREDLQNLTEHYVSLQLEFKIGSVKILEDKQILALLKQMDYLDELCSKLNSKKCLLEESLKNSCVQFQEIKEKQHENQIKLNEFKSRKADKIEDVEEIEELVELNENLRTQEIQFREYCKKELVKLQNLIDRSRCCDFLQADPGTRAKFGDIFIEGYKALSTNRFYTFGQVCEALMIIAFYTTAKGVKETKHKKPVIKSNKEVSKLSKELSADVKLLRLQVAKRNRTVAAVHRQIDDVPNRPELAQYQRRFLELYSQVSAKHRETKQYYTLYNTMEDTKVYMKKELSLLNSISDSYPEAIISSYGKEEFLKQFQNIIEGVTQSKEKVQKQLLDEKRKRDQLSSSLQILIEQQRKYVTAVRQLSIECKKHEILLNRHTV
ncbi:coiled-coil domain-containing protein 93 isoform X3 [Tenebrio molitor]|uniref:coiled-coil domain-containing protein 93 isoform X3 n=1 Tax=Tenebrio molitor TaxID=7067 RepID=UPI0036247CE9